LTNAIELSSNGWQLAVNIPVFSSKDFTWDFTVIWSHQTSMIDKVEGAIYLFLALQKHWFSYCCGKKSREIYGYKTLTSVNQLRSDGKTPFIDPADQEIMK
jgi:hypothetical protein